MPDQVVAAVTGAVTGAVCGGVVSGLIGIIKYVSKRLALKKALRVGLYFEIDHHNITSLSNDPDGQPNFLITGFQDYFYKSNISNIVRLFSPEILMRLAFYYSKIQIAKGWQDDVLKLAEKIDVLACKGILTDADKSQLNTLVMDRANFKNLLRVTIAPCIETRNRLLGEFLKGLPLDPSTVAYIDVPPEHQDWWNSKVLSRVR